MPKSQTLSFPPTATHKLLQQGSSHASFRRLIYNLFTIGSRIEEIRSHLGKRMGLSGPQFTLIIAVAELQGDRGVSVGKIGDYLHVTGTFVTIESGKLKKKGFLAKKSSDEDRRVTLLSLTPKALEEFHRIAPELQQLNDTVFSFTSRQEFTQLCDTMDRLVSNSDNAVHLVRITRGRP